MAVNEQAVRNRWPQMRDCGLPSNANGYVCNLLSQGQRRSVGGAHAGRVASCEYLAYEVPSLWYDDTGNSGLIVLEVVNSFQHTFSGAHSR